MLFFLGQCGGCRGNENRVKSWLGFPHLYPHVQVSGLAGAGFHDSSESCGAGSIAQWVDYVLSMYNTLGLISSTTYMHMHTDTPTPLWLISLTAPVQTKAVCMGSGKPRAVCRKASSLETTDCHGQCSDTGRKNICKKVCKIDSRSHS